MSDRALRRGGCRRWLSGWVLICAVGLTACGGTDVRQSTTASSPSSRTGGAPSTSTSGASMPAVAGSSGGTVSGPPHVMVLVMENESYGNIIGNSSAPYENYLAKHYLTATDSYAWGHNSLPNYLEMISGHAYTSQGTKQDCSPKSCGRVTGSNLATQLQAVKIPWKAYMGGMPTPCDQRNAGGKGGYGVRHDPFVYFPQGRRPPQCSHDLPSTQMISQLDGASPPDFVFYSPAICHDGGHDASCSTIANGDRFLARRVPAIMATAWYKDRGTIILTWDEGNSNAGNYGDFGGHVLTVVISAAAKGSGSHGGYLDTAGVLRSVEHAYGLSYLGKAASARSGMLTFPG